MTNPKIYQEITITCHLFLSHLHTNDAPSTIIRLIDMGIQPLFAREGKKAIEEMIRISYFND